jgi:CDP-paratose 2-epimerase
MRCAVDGTKYTVCGYKAKQVRDNIHSADLVDAIMTFHASPRSAQVYNMGGGRKNNCSMLEAIALCEKISGHRMNWDYSEQSRIGDHIWYVSDTRRFEGHYPAWEQKYGLEETLREIFEANRFRLRA